jgi:hypothetical protein
MSEALLERASLRRLQFRRGRAGFTDRSLNRLAAIPIPHTVAWQRSGIGDDRSGLRPVAALFDRRKDRRLKAEDPLL